MGSHEKSDFIIMFAGVRVIRSFGPVNVRRYQQSFKKGSESLVVMAYHFTFANVASTRNLKTGSLIVDFFWKRYP